MSSKRGRNIVKWIIFIAYIAVMVYFLFFAELLDRMPAENYRYNLEPLREIKRFIAYRDIIGTKAVLLNLFGNIVAFVPFGMALVSMSSKKPGFIAVVIYSAAFSTAIELVQLITRVGSCDVDDIILNTLGGAIGYVLYRLIKMCKKRWLT
ncbi:MAG: VanZ family protein [Clostridia bacterium]|nr:VanZ family protein [[Bacteroides] pectinophilus]MDD5874112.1 VanZ family protein [Clostridia bacterium]